MLRNTGKVLVPSTGTNPDHKTTLIYLNHKDGGGNAIALNQPPVGESYVSISSSGGSHFLALTDTSSVYVSGSGKAGQLGLGENERGTISTLIRHPFFDGIAVASVHVGFAQSAAISKMGSFFLWGSGYDLIWSPKVIPIQDGFQAKDCALGENHVVVYGKNREGVSEVYSWGHGGLGQLGHGSTKDQPNPVCIISLKSKDMTHISSGSNHTVVVSDGILYFWGTLIKESYYSYSPLPISIPHEIIRDCCCGPKSIIMITDSGRMYTFGEGPNLGIDVKKPLMKPKLIESLKTYFSREVALGYNHAIAVVDPRIAKSNEIPSEVFFWGTTGTIIKPEPERINLFSGLNILQVAGGAGYSLALKDLVNEDNTNVKHIEGHIFEPTQLNFPVRCTCCQKFVFSRILKVTWKCKLCGSMCHHKCIYISVPPCEGLLRSDSSPQLDLTSINEYSPYSSLENLNKTTNINSNNSNNNINNNSVTFVKSPRSNNSNNNLTNSANILKEKQSIEEIKEMEFEVKRRWSRAHMQFTLRPSMANFFESMGDNFPQIPNNNNNSSNNNSSSNNNNNSRGRLMLLHNQIKNQSKESLRKISVRNDNQSNENLNDINNKNNNEKSNNSEKISVNVKEGDNNNINNEIENKKALLQKKIDKKKAKLASYQTLCSDLETKINKLQDQLQTSTFDTNNNNEKQPLELRRKIKTKAKEQLLKVKNHGTKLDLLPSSSSNLLNPSISSSQPIISPRSHSRSNSNANQQESNSNNIISDIKNINNNEEKLKKKNSIANINIEVNKEEVKPKNNRYKTKNVHVEVPVEPVDDFNISASGDFSNMIHTKTWVIETSKIEIDKQLGEGASAQVYLGIYRGQDVAIKVMKNQMNKKQLLDFESEFEVMREMRSKYNVFFFGICLNPNLCLVMENCESGSLYDCISSRSCKISWSRTFKILLDIVRGVNCLHNWEPQVVHRDLKTHNLLVDGNWNVKIADFGLARLATDQLRLGGTLGKLCGTYSYCDPEIYNGQSFTDKSDIYSLGVIIWELITRVVTGVYKRPYGEYPELQFDFQVIIQTSRGKRCTIHPATPPSFIQLINHCWDARAVNRPTSKELVKKILALQQEYKENVDLWNSSYFNQK